MNTKLIQNVPMIDNLRGRHGHGSVLNLGAMKRNNIQLLALSDDKESYQGTCSNLVVGSPAKLTSV